MCIYNVILGIETRNYPNSDTLTPEGIPYGDARDYHGYRYSCPPGAPSITDPDYESYYTRMMYLKYHNKNLYDKMMRWD